MQKLSGTVQGFCCLPTKHSLINLDRRAREDSEALNQMLQFCLLAKGSAVWTESINSVYGTGRSHTLKSGRCSCWEEPLGSAGQFTALTQCWMCAVVSHGSGGVAFFFLHPCLLSLFPTICSEATASSCRWERTSLEAPFPSMATWQGNLRLLRVSGDTRWQSSLSSQVV